MKHFFVKSIKFYQSYISILTPASCRYYPSCSEYAIWIFKNENIFFAFFKTLVRILKCNQFFNGGIDYPIIKKSPHLNLILQKKSNFLEISNIEFWLILYKKDKFYLIKNQQKGSSSD